MNVRDRVVGKVLALFTFLALAGNLLAEPIPIRGANGKTIPFAGVKEALPGGLVLQIQPGGEDTAVPWDKFDLEALKTDHPQIHAAYLKAQAGESTVLELGSYNREPLSIDLPALIADVKVHEAASKSPADEYGIAPYLYTASYGDSLPFRFGVPREGLGEGERAPLVVWLHGSGSGGQDNSRHIDMRLVRRLFESENGAHSCFFLAPQCREDYTWWNAPPRLGIAGGQTLDLIDRLCRDVQAIDSTRVYLIGNSQGAFGIPHLVTSYPNRFAAAVMIAGGSKAPYAPWSRKNAIPTWTFYSTDDPVVMQFNGVVPQMFRQLQELSDDTMATAYDDAGHGGTYVRAMENEELFPWLFRHRNDELPRRDDKLIKEKFLQ